MYIICVENEVINVVNTVNEVKDCLSIFDEVSDVLVSEWSSNAGGWYCVAEYDYYVHDGIVGSNE